MPLLASNFTSNLLYGTTIVAGGWANVNLTVDAFAFEGDKTFAVKLRKDSTLGQVIGTSAPITIKDYTTIVGLSANISTVNEGNLVQFTLTTTNVVNYTNVAYSVFPATANVTADDFVANTGYITIINNVGTFALKANADVSLIDESGENFRVQIRDKNSTNVFISSNITIGDVSRGINVLSFTESATTTAEGGTLTLTFTATNANNVIIFYSTDGNATSSTFTGGNTGSFILNGISNTVTLLPTGVPYGTTQNFRVVLRSDTATGPIVTTSNSLIAIDSSIAYMSATGGTIVDANGYKTHIFTSTANLNVTSLGVSGNIQVLVVAGGGSGGAAYQGGGGGGGGGAGGFRTSNLTLSSTGNILVTVGGGGAYNGTSPTIDQNGGSGSPSIFSTITSTGGGGGGNRTAGVPGGSGGGFGGGGGGTPPVGLGNTPATSPPQGNPGGYGGPGDCSGGGGGSSTPGNPGGPAISVGGAGGTGSPASGWDIPSSYGVSGPAPGRWFSGGGGGGGNNGSGAGGNGGGGQAAPVGSPAGTDGTPTTGGGGGGATGGNYPGTRAGSGGSGIVVVRYPYAPPITVSNVLTTANLFIVGSNITFTISTTYANTLTLYYTTEGNVDSSYFIGGNTGSFVANANGNVFTLIGNTNATVPVGQTRNFRLQIRQDSTTGFISGLSANVALVASADYYMQATGGNVSIANGYKTHIFTTSGNLNVTGLGVTSSASNAEILVVAGGGGGSDQVGNGGGGGAGGLLYGNINLAVQNYMVIIGAGGSFNATGVKEYYGPNHEGYQGSPTTLSPSIVAIGGGGGAGNYGTNTPGGSGGGGAWYYTASSPGTQGPSGGLTGYGNPGSPGPANSGAGGGGGALGAGQLASSNASGGAGFPSSISGSSQIYAAGGGVTPTTQGAAVANTGKGGSTNPAGQTGSPGIVIIRYPYS